MSTLPSREELLSISPGHLDDLHEWHRAVVLAVINGRYMDREAIDPLQALVAEQAEDDALWFVTDSITEAYFQQELRRLHAAIEGVGDEP